MQKKNGKKEKELSYTYLPIYKQCKFSATTLSPNYTVVPLESIDSQRTRVILFSLYVTPPPLMNFFFSFAKEVASGGDVYALCIHCTSLYTCAHVCTCVQSLLIKTRTYGRPYTTTIHPLTPFRLFYKLSGDCPAPGFSGARGHARKQDASGGERGYRQTKYMYIVNIFNPSPSMALWRQWCLRSTRRNKNLVSISRSTIKFYIETQ